MALARLRDDVPLPHGAKNDYAMQSVVVYQESESTRSVTRGASQSVVKMILEHLKALQEELPECQVVALVDLSSGIVLCVSAKVKQPQERLDALCKTATELLVGQTAESFANALEVPQAPMLEQCVITSQTETFVFLRLPQDTPEALILVCSPMVDAAKLLGAAKSRFDAIAASQ